jgi:transposase
MNVSTLLADPTAVHLDAFVSGDNSITLRIHSIQEQSICPSCNLQSGSLHSNYLRSVADLPWHNVAVKLELHVRKFRCRNELCSQKVFCERLPKVAGKYARKTVRLETVLTYLAFALGGEAGARTAGRLQVITSGDTLLRLIRRRMNPSAIEPPDAEVPRVIGVDDWAWRKGCNYGTIIVDLERRKVIDLLPDREAETLAGWLRKHQTVETVARDRSPTYRCGIVDGQPDAVQVADRWHLLKNLSDVLKCLIERLQRKRKPATKSNDEQINDFVTVADSISIEPNFDLPDWEWVEHLNAAIKRIERQSRNFRLLPHLPADFLTKPPAEFSVAVNPPPSRRVMTALSARRERASGKIDARTLIKLCFRGSKPRAEESELLEKARDEWDELDRLFLSLKSSPK